MSTCKSQVVLTIEDSSKIKEAMKLIRNMLGYNIVSKEGIKILSLKERVGTLEDVYLEVVK